MYDINVAKMYLLSCRDMQDIKLLTRDWQPAFKKQVWDLLDDRERAVIQEHADVYAAAERLARFSRGSIVSEYAVVERFGGFLDENVCEEEESDEAEGEAPNGRDKVLSRIIKQGGLLDGLSSSA